MNSSKKKEKEKIRFQFITSVHNIRRKIAPNVYLVKKTDNNQIYASKELTTGSRELILYDEIKSFNNPHILQFIGFFDHEGQTYIVIEYAEEGDLSNYLHKNPKIYSDINEILSLSIQIIDGLFCLHRNKILHRDIKPQNILVFLSDDGPLLKICDFDISTCIQTSETVLTINRGTEYYSAPEINTSKYTYPVDIWSLGAVFYEFFSNGKLFYNQFPRELNHPIFENITEILNRDVKDKFFNYILLHMLQINPNDRISASFLLFFTYIYSLYKVIPDNEINDILLQRYKIFYCLFMIFRLYSFSSIKFNSLDDLRSLIKIKSDNIFYIDVQSIKDYQTFYTPNQEDNVLKHLINLYLFKFKKSSDPFYNFLKGNKKQIQSSQNEFTWFQQELLTFAKNSLKSDSDSKDFLLFKEYYDTKIFQQNLI